MLYYNENMKNKYIAALNGSSVKYASEYFQQSAEFENRKGKDIALFTNEEWFEFLFEINVVTINKAYRYYMFFAEYAQFYFAECKSEQKNHFMEIDKDKLTAYTSGIVNKEACISRELLLKMIAEIPSYVDQFLILCLYEGVRGEEYKDVMCLKESDIDTENNIFHLQSGKSIKVSQELVDIALRAAKQNSYVLPQSPFSTKRPSGGNLDDTEYIFRVRDNSSKETPDVSRIYNRFMAYKDFFENPEFTPPRLSDSGLTYGIRTLMDLYQKTQVKYIYAVPEMNELKERYDYANTETRFIARRLKRNGYL